jgi:hypothetical protein
MWCFVEVLFLEEFLTVAQQEVNQLALGKSSSQRSHVLLILLTLVFNDIAHLCSSGKNQCSNLLDDLGLFTGAESCEPFGQTNLALTR